MKVGVVGSRTFDNVGFLWEKLDGCLWMWGPFTVVSGGAEGADTLAETWAVARDMYREVYEAAWADLTYSDALIKTRRDGSKYDARAGFRRNQTIVDTSDVLLAFMDPDNPTNGTSDTIRRARKKGIQVYILWPGKDPTK
jgi:hypothetical protein